MYLSFYPDECVWWFSDILVQHTSWLFCLNLQMWTVYLVLVVLYWSALICWSISTSRAWSQSKLKLKCAHIIYMLFGSLTSWNCKHIEFIYCVCKCTSCFSCTKAAAVFWWLGLMSRNASSCFLYHLLLNTITVQDFLVSIIVMKYVVHLNKIGFVNFQDARVWLPDPTLVWKCATLLEDFKGQKQLAIRYDDGSVSSVITVYQSLPI